MQGLVKADNLKKHYSSGNVEAVKGISFSLSKGSIVALLGANGAGKSTTIKMLTGLIKPSSGSLTLFQTTYDVNPDLIRTQFGYVPEESAMYEDIGIYDYLRFFGSIYKVPHHTVEKRILTLLKQLDLDVGNRLIGHLSKGMKRKVLIARSLLHDPPLLIYDEPASGLDPKTAHFILQFMIELKQKGKAILFSSHHLAHVEQIADTVLIMHKGSLITNASLGSLVQASNHFSVTFDDGSVSIAKNADALQKLLSDKKKVVDVKQEHKTLEEVFLELTQ